MIALVLASTPLQMAPARAVDRAASAPSAQGLFSLSRRRHSRTPERFTVKIGLKEMGVAPAGVVKQFTGHHHLLIDTDMVPLDQPIPSDYNHHSSRKWTNRDGADAASRNSHLAATARRPPAFRASASGHVEEDHDLCALAKQRHPQGFAPSGTGPVQSRSPDWRNAERAPGGPCLLMSLMANVTAFGQNTPAETSGG